MTFTVPGYRVDRLLGAGSQGEVWLGEQLASGERVALKRISVESPAVVAAARAEAALLAALDHPSLIALRAFVPMDSAMVLVLELAEAGTLAGLLRRRGRLTPPEVVATISPVAAALAHAHAAGVLHGDVSAANILFNTAGYPKLADLGLARMLAATTDPPLGTPAYLDPTIAAGGPAGVASDVFSLAAVALHALTGAGPWCCPGASAPTAEQVLAVAATGEIADLDRRLRDVPAELAEVLMRALTVEPHRRGTAAELALDLRAALPPTPVTLAGGRIVEPVGRHSVERVPGGVFPAAAGAVVGGPKPADPTAVGLSFVPIDLTRVTPVRPSADVATALRTGGLAADPGDCERPVRTPGRRPGLAGRWRAGWPDRLGGLRRYGGSHGQSAPGWRRRAGAIRRVTTRRFGRPVRIVAMLLMSGLIGAALVLGWPGLHRRPVAAETGMPGERPAGAATAGSLTPGPSAAGRSGTAGAGRPTDGPAGSTAGTPDAAMSADRLAAVLAALDAVRERAFAERRPELLAEVYASSSLLAADTEQLTSTVPVGCRLVGVRTGYRDPQPVAAAGNRPVGNPSTGSPPTRNPPAGVRSVAVTVTATLPSASLRCAGVVRSRTRPAGPTRLRLLLTDSGAGWRVASERLG
jgi:hypothetical protein